MHEHNHVGRTLNELYRIFDKLNEKYYENKLEPPIITIQKAKRKGNLGWFTTSKMWQSKQNEDNDIDNEFDEFDIDDNTENQESIHRKYEINVCSEHLNSELEEIVGTLHHEMVHYLNATLGIKDCNGNKHNKKFKNAAEQLDLIVEKSKKCGYGHTTCNSRLQEFINEEIKPDETYFTFYRCEAESKEKKPRVKKVFKYTCPKCGEIVKAKPETIISCGKCEVEFEMESE